MGKYPLIEKMGLRIDQMWPVNTVTYSGNIGYSVIKADDLEAALEKATVVYGNIENERFWGSYERDGDTKKAILICVEELKREPVKVEFYTDIESVRVIDVPVNLPSTLMDKKVKITIEELP